MKKLTCEWRKLVFVNYLVPPEILERHLPSHTELDYFNGHCYVSLVGFQFKNVKAAGVPVPFHTDFEEINLRFYVKRFGGHRWRHGVVFLNEIVDRPALSVLANSVFNENYRTLPTSQKVKEEHEKLTVGYSWQNKEHEESLWVHAGKTPSPMPKDSESKFLIHRFWGYGKRDKEITHEYDIIHPEWLTYRVEEYSVSVDFIQFGAEFSILNGSTPQSVMLAEGSTVEVKGSSRIEN